MQRQTHSHKCLRDNAEKSNLVIPQYHNATMQRKAMLAAQIAPLGSALILCKITTWILDFRDNAEKSNVAGSDGSSWHLEPGCSLLAAWWLGGKPQTQNFDFDLEPGSWAGACRVGNHKHELILKMNLSSAF